MSDKNQIDINLDINNINVIYNKIIDNFTNYNTNIKNIYEDIKKLESVHNIYINTADMSSVNYSIYVDDIKHQINLTRIEYDYVNNIYNINIEKMYRDLFKLYNRITKVLLTIFKDNKDVIIKIWKSSERIDFDSSDFKKLKKSIKIIADNSRSNNPLSNDNKIFDEIKKQYYLDLKIYNEIEKTQSYELQDIIKIFDMLIKRLEELYLSRELIRMNLIDVQNKTEKGILGQTFIMDLNGKSDRIRVDYNIMLKLLESTLNIHLSLVERYNNISLIISKQVNYDDDTTLSSDGEKSSNDIFINKDGKIRIRKGSLLNE
jgi:hypothetical protein